VKQAPPALAHLAAGLRALDATGLLRKRPEPLQHGASSFCSNDYLGLAALPAPDAPSGAGASRLIAGERLEHLALERAIAEWLRTPSALLFSSGYAANLGTVAALVEPPDIVISDELNHASLIDGCRLARANVEIVPHLDVPAVERALRRPRAGRAWVLTESYFSMDADSPDLVRLRELCDQHGAALLVDEAHAVGVFGPAGRGLCAQVEVLPDVLVGTLGKAFGASGAFVAGSEVLVDWLWNRARSFVFSTGVSPVVAAAARRALGVASRDEALRLRLHANATHLRRGLTELGLQPRGVGPIIPLVVGDPVRAVQAAAELCRLGIQVQAVRPPTVSPRTSRLRVTVSAIHSPSEIERAILAFEQAKPWLTPSF
jgi:8-amino-7-oxononanoate synthase